ncbi:MAG: MBL fold metallo-hydrolase [Myxococcota bacterium]|nr:MBL fold metallo-hydrolase [Myxococcales bacterium]
MAVRTPRAGTTFGLERAPVPSLPSLHRIVLPTPWEVGPVQIYVVDGDPLTLIDTGVRSAPSRAALESAFDALGRGLDEVRRVVLTHYHADHLGQAQLLRELGGDVEVGAHEDEVAMIEGFSEERDERIHENEELFRVYGVDDDTRRLQESWVRSVIAESPALCAPTRVDRVLRDGDAVAFKGFELRVHHAPGHTIGHVVLEEPESGTLLTGDTVMGNAVPSTTTYFTSAHPDASDPLRRRQRFRGLPAYLSSLRRLRALDPRTILPAHGGTLRRPSRAIDDALLFYDVRIQRIERGLRNLDALGQDATAWEIWRALFPKADPVREMRNRMLMVIGALDVLEAKGLCVTSWRDDGVLVHRHAHA